MGANIRIEISILGILFEPPSSLFVDYKLIWLIFNFDHQPNVTKLIQPIFLSVIVFGRAKEVLRLDKKIFSRW